MTHQPDTTRDCNGGQQRLYNFPNGYSASVVCHDFSYGHEDGLFELAVLHGNSLVYDTEIVSLDSPHSGVLGCLTEQDVQTVLAQIEKLPARE